jgi:hypothetical protein
MSKFNLFLNSKSSHIEQSTSKLNIEIGFKRKETRAALKSILCNLFIKPNSWILTSRKKQPRGTKKGNPLGLGIQSFIDVLDALHQQGFIEQNIGSKLENKQTEIKATEDLLIWFEYNNWSYDDIDSFNPQRITLRLNEDKKSFVDPDTDQFFTWLDSKLKDYNGLLNASVICLPNNGVLEQLRNISTHKGFIKHEYHPDKGGLLFGGRHVGPWVGLSKDDRGKITINGESTIEYDRKASHVNAMYEVATGSPYPDEYGDPYEIMVNGRLVPRHIAKNLLSFSQGANSPRGVSSRVGRSYKDKANNKSAKQCDIDNLDEWKRFTKKVSGTKIHKVLMMKHYLVKDYYLRGKQYGDMIQCLEADLVFEVVIELIKKGIPCLTVYDSFIVQSKHEALVKDLVKKTRFVNRRSIANLLEVDQEVAFSQSS